jgi:hypothetical protein
MSKIVNIKKALRGETPETVPFSVYDRMVDDPTSLRWQEMFEMGLIRCRHCDPMIPVYHGGVKFSETVKQKNGDKIILSCWETPQGNLHQKEVNGWRVEYFIKEDSDYAIMDYILKNTEYTPDSGAYQRELEEVGDHGIVVYGQYYHRSPLMKINVDFTGTEKFSIDLAYEKDELFNLYESYEIRLLEMVKIMAEGPGDIIKFSENLTFEMLGPKRYEELLLPAYRKLADVIHRGGKKMSVHYDGGLKALSHLVNEGAFDIIESLTEPPEGDMTFDECRKYWPDKIFWANINLGLYDLPAEELAENVKEKVRRAGKRGLVFEISEDIPKRWYEGIPVILNALNSV